MTAARHPIPAARSRRAATRARRAFTLLEILIVVGIILILASLVVSVSSALLKRAERTSVENAMATVESALAEYEATVGRPMTYDGSRGTAWIDVWSPDTAIPTTASGLINNSRGQGVYAINLLRQMGATSSFLAAMPTDLLRQEPFSSTYPPVNLSSTTPTSVPYQPSARSLVPVGQRGGLAMSDRAELVDAWGNRVLFIFPGRPYRFGAEAPGTILDPDGTVRTPFEALFASQGLGICANRRICMVSAGPDGLLGIDGEVTPNLTATQRLAAQADNIYSYELEPAN